MCEFKVFLDGEKVFEDVVHIKTTEGEVVLGNILGEQRKFKDCIIQEIDVASEKLTLSSTGSGIGHNTSLEMESLEGTLTKAARFHGHLGPFLVVGVRMGRLALEKLNTKRACTRTHDQYNSLLVVVETGSTPPISCMVDGIQWSTGCTLGRGTIRIEDLGRPAARFKTEGRELRIALKNRILEKIENSLKLHPSKFKDLNEEIVSQKEDELFQIN